MVVYRPLRWTVSIAVLVSLGAACDGAEWHETDDGVPQGGASATWSQTGTSGRETTERVEADLVDAVVRGDVGAVEALLARGVDPDLGRRAGLTPLMLATNRDDDTLTELLLAAGADPDLVDRSGLSAAHIAAESDAVRSLGVLIGGGASIDLVSDGGLTPFEQAATSGSTEALRLLMAHVADIDAPSEVVLQGHDHYPRDRGTNALGLAVRWGRLDVVRALLAGGADVNVRSPVGIDALLLAVFSDQSPAMLELLLDAGARSDTLVRCSGSCSGIALDAAGWADELDRTDLIPLLDGP